MVMVHQAKKSDQPYGFIYTKLWFFLKSWLQFLVSFQDVFHGGKKYQLRKLPLGY
jgi:hypothetical protein